MTDEKKKEKQKIKYMKAALRCAERALKGGEVPIGAVVVYQGKIIGRGYNRRLKTQLASAHAEMMAIDAACRKLHSWRLPEAEIYVTLEPCPMCMGAVLNARIDKLYFGAYEQKGRSFTRELANANLLNHTVEVEGGIMQEACGGLITKNYSDMREREREKNKKEE